jgi:DNA-binding Xre family transcriptional regulator
MTHTNLEVALAKLGWNQGDLARETGYQRGEISRMCTGKRSIPLVLQRFLELKLLVEVMRLHYETIQS